MRFLVGLFLVCYGVAATAQVQIEITGVTNTLIKNVRAYMSLEQQKDRSDLSPARIRRLHRQAPEQIRQALRPFGYYRAKVKSDLVPPVAEGDPWQARYRIDPGLPVTITKVDVKVFGSGRRDPAFQELLADFPVSIGDILNHPNYDQGKQQLQDLADARGYFDAVFKESTLRVDVATDRAEVVLHFQTGERYRFGAIEYDQDFFNNAFLERFITLKPGDFYTSRAVSRLRSSFNESGYFERVKIETQRDAERKQLTLKVTPVFRKPNRYRARIGFGTDTGPRARLDWQRRYLNRFGHRLTAGLTAKGEKKEFIADINYIIPLGRNVDNYLVATLSHESKDISVDDTNIIVADEAEQLNFDETRSNKLSYKLSKNKRRDLLGRVPLNETLSLEYFNEEYNLFNILPTDFAELIEASFPEVKPVLDADFKLLMPGLSWSYRKSNDRLYTTRGERIEFGIRGARDGLGSNLTFWQGRLSGALVRRIGDQGRIIARSDFGYTEADEVPFFDLDLNVLPESIQFKTGGGRSVRGYGFEEIDINGLGGRHLVVSSLEYEHRVFESWGLAAFYDAGDVFDNFSDVELNKGTGGGLRWYSPLGPIRLDVARALSKGGNPLRVHFSVGSEF